MAAQVGRQWCPGGTGWGFVPFVALRLLAPAPALPLGPQDRRHSRGRAPRLARQDDTSAAPALHQCEHHLYVIALKAMAADCMADDQGLHELLNRAVTSTEAWAAFEAEVRTNDGRRALNRWARHWALLLAAPLVCPGARPDDRPRHRASGGIEEELAVVKAVVGDRAWSWSTRSTTVPRPGRPGDRLPRKRGSGWSSLRDSRHHHRRLAIYRRRNQGLTTRGQTASNRCPNVLVPSWSPGPCYTVRTGYLSVASGSDCVEHQGGPFQFGMFSGAPWTRIRSWLPAIREEAGCLSLFNGHAHHPKSELSTIGPWICDSLATEVPTSTRLLLGAMTSGVPGEVLLPGDIPVVIAVLARDRQPIRDSFGG